MNPDPPVFEQARHEAEQASRQFGLPFLNQSWKGSQGSWLGAGTGSSLDFQDHRAYQWGDDPRSIHWAAYARTGQLSLKLYRAELAPVVDIVIDVSPSMSLNRRKSICAEALLQFCLAGADRGMSPARIHAVDGECLTPLEADDVRAGTWRRALKKTQTPAAMPHIPVWGANRLKILISDLLYPGPPSLLLSAMAAGGGVSVVYAPSAEEESTLPARGNVRLLDCESGEQKHVLISSSVASRYRQAYQTHFDLWRQTCRKYGVLMSPVSADLPLPKALSLAPFREGAVLIL